MKPGREMDALVAEKVMGLPPGKAHRVAYQDEPVIEYEFPGPKYREFKPSTDIAAAFQVVEKMRSDGFDFCMEGFSGGQWWAGLHRVGGGPDYEERGDSLPAVLCLAALRAVGALK